MAKRPRKPTKSYYAPNDKLARRMQDALVRYDEAVTKLEMKWGVDRLPWLVGRELREKFDMQMDRLNEAIERQIDVEHQVEVTLRGLAALEKAATEKKIGKFEAAHKGTLVLDEIGEMSPAIQAKFLRVLEGHPFERVGGSNRVNVDVRVVAATNRNLEEAVAGGDFRRDLYFRLKVVEIVVPPLRRRPEDIEAIATHFLTRFAAETGRTIKGFSPEALEALRAYHWPGNIRELRNVIERAVVLAQGEWIEAHDMALSQLATPGDTGKAPAARQGTFVPTTIEEMERRHVMETLEAVGGNKTKAAAILGIERSTLDRKLAKWARA